jgi:molybdopterin-guanine dinucleotide biosynthesis protein A
MSKTETRFAAMVLCGGKSSRMGTPKMALPFGTELVLQRMVRVVGSVVSPVAVVRARAQAIPELPAETVIVTDLHDDKGPLAGLYSGLTALSHAADAVYATSCDAPLLKPEFVRFVCDQLQDADMAICRDGKYHHPLASVYRTHLADKIAKLINAERLRPVFLLEDCNARLIDVETARHVDSKLDSLQNMNTPDDYRMLLKQAGLASAGEAGLKAE